MTPSLPLEEPKQLDTLSLDQIITEKSKLKRQLAQMKESFADRLKKGETV
jgi:hypothetical protein